MAMAYRLFTKGFFVVLALTTLLWLAGIIFLPTLGPPYADEAEAQTSDDSSAVQRPTNTRIRNAALPAARHGVAAGTTRQNGANVP